MVLESRKQRKQSIFALYGSDKCDWVTIAARIARDEPDRFGSGHPCGAIGRQAVKRLIQAVARESTDVFLGRRRALPEQAINLNLMAESFILFDIKDSFISFDIKDSLYRNFKQPPKIYLKVPEKSLKLSVT